MVLVALLFPIWFLLTLGVGEIKLPSISIVSLSGTAYQAIFHSPVVLLKRYYHLFLFTEGRLNDTDSFLWDKSNQVTNHTRVRSWKHKCERKIRDCSWFFILLDEGIPEISLSLSLSLSLCLCVSKQALQNPNKGELMKHHLTAGALVSKQTPNKPATKPDLLSSTVSH